MPKQVEKYVIVGNGFDVNLGIKSTYSDFMRKMGSIHQLTTDADYKKYNSLFQRDSAGNWSDFESYFEELIFRANSLEDEWLAYDIIGRYNTDVQRLEQDFYNYMLSAYHRWKQEQSGVLNPVYQAIFTDATVLTFNYTETLSELGISDRARKIYQLHGNLVNRNIIFGGGFLEHMKVSELRYPGSTLNEKLVRIKKDHVLTAEREGLLKDLSSDQDVELYILGHSISGSDLNFLSDLLYKARKIYLFYYGEDYASKMQVLITEFGREMLEKVVLVPFVDVQISDEKAAFKFNLVDKSLDREEIGEEELKTFQQLFNFNIPTTKEFEKIWITGNSLNSKDIHSILLKSDKEAADLEWILKFISVEEGEDCSFPIEIENIGPSDTGLPTLVTLPTFSMFLSKSPEIRIRNSCFFVDDLFEQLKGNQCHTIKIWDSRLETEKPDIFLSDFPNLKELEIVNSSFDGEILRGCGQVFKIVANKSATINVDDEDLVIYPENEKEK